MPKIYQALATVAKEREKVSRVIQLPGTKAVTNNNPIGHKMTEMYQLIRSQRTNDSTGVIQFIGTHKGAGTSTLLRTFAEVVSTRLEKSVLIVDADPQASQAAHFTDLSDSSSSKSNPNVIRRVGNSNLYLIQARFGRDSDNAYLGLPYTQRQLVALKKHYDLVLVDSGPSQESSDNIALTKNVDGVIIVLEANKTRWQVAHHLKEKIEQQGTRILGTMLNGHRHHIPDFVYKRL